MRHILRRPDLSPDVWRYLGEEAAAEDALLVPLAEWRRTPQAWAQWRGPLGLRLAPVDRVEEKLTYHDPCFLGRHNKVFSPPREIIDAVPGTQAEEMPRCKNRGFCCGAGGARMWMEERIGKRINTERIDEALELNPDKISTACPYCMVMLGDAVEAKKASGEAKETLEVIDVAQLLIRSVRADKSQPAS